LCSRGAFTNFSLGWLTGLVDLNTERDNVQERIADYLTDLIGIGFSGFRIDAAKVTQNYYL
jgi:glycosidase